MFKGAEVSIPRADFMFSMAEILYDQAQLFAPKKLDDPAKMRLFAEEALDALKPLPANKDAKGLNQRIEKSLKDAKSRMS
jgi:hypothetical protein